MQKILACKNWHWRKCSLSLEDTGFVHFLLHESKLKFMPERKVLNSLLWKMSLNGCKLRWKSLQKSHTFCMYFHCPKVFLAGGDYADDLLSDAQLSDIKSQTYVWFLLFNFRTYKFFSYISRQLFDLRCNSRMYLGILL